METAQDLREARDPANVKVCIVGASGKLGRYMAQHALDRGYEVVGVCREQSVAKLDALKGRMTVLPGATDDREVIRKAVAGCDGGFTVLAPRGVHGYSTGTAQAVLDFASPAARIVFSCGWRITRDGQDVYSRKLKWTVSVLGGFAKLIRVADLNDQVEACRRVFASDTRWTVVRGGKLEEGGSRGLPVWSRHVGDPILESNITRRVNFALLMVAAIEDDELVHEAPASVGCQAPPALAHAGAIGAHPDQPAPAAPSWLTRRTAGRFRRNQRCCQPTGPASQARCGQSTLPWSKQPVIRPPDRAGRRHGVRRESGVGLGLGGRAGSLLLLFPCPVGAAGTSTAALGPGLPTVSSSVPAFLSPRSRSRSPRWWVAGLELGCPLDDQLASRAGWVGIVPQHLRKTDAVPSLGS